MSIIFEPDEKQEYEYIKLEISNMIINIIEKNIPHKWLPTTEPFINKYNGRISYDKSGEVCKISETDLKKIIKEIERKQNTICYSPPLEVLLEQIKIDKWTATYRSNYGKHWISYNDILKGKFNYWKYNNFKINDNGNYADHKLYSCLDNIFYDFIENAPYKFYSAKLLAELKKIKLFRTK